MAQLTHTLHLFVCVCVCHSAGCGRTGVICALSYIHDLLVTKVTPHNTWHDHKLTFDSAFRRLQWNQRVLFSRREESCQISCVSQEIWIKRSTMTRAWLKGCVRVLQHSLITDRNEGDATPSLSPAADHSRLQHHEDRPDAPDSETLCCPN